MSAPDQSGRKREILIAEDDPLNRVLLATYLEEAGYRVAVANDGLQALGLIRTELPDLVITDINMPEMNGYELCRRLRSHHKLARIPIIMLSGRTEASEILAGYAEGADDYLSKPIDFAVLGAKIEVLLQRTQSAIAADPSAGVVLFLHASGGVGSTTFAVNLACLLQRISATGACLLDLSHGFGGAARQMGLAPRLSLADLALQATDETTTTKFERFIFQAAAGPSLVVATTRPEHVQLVNVPSIHLALDSLRSRFQYILVDAPASMSEEVLAAIDVADLVWVVTGPSRANRAATRELLNVLERHGVSAGRRLLIQVSAHENSAEQDPESPDETRPQVRIEFSKAIQEASDGAIPLAQSDPGSRDLATISELAAGLQDTLIRNAGRPPVSPRAPAAP